LNDPFYRTPPHIDYYPRNAGTPPDAINGDVIRSMPPQCIPDSYDNIKRWTGDHIGHKSYLADFNSGWFFNTGMSTAPDPFVAEPLTRAPPPMDTLVTAIIPGTTPPPFVGVPHSDIIKDTATTATPVRQEISEWWKLWLLIGALLLLLTVLLMAMFCGPKERIRTPIKRVEEEIPIVVKEEVIVEKPKPVIVEEKVYSPTKRQVMIEKQPVVRVEEQILVKEKIGYNPYKQKNVDFRL
jgi:hypothetical protein